MNLYKVTHHLMHSPCRLKDKVSKVIYNIINPSRTAQASQNQKGFSCQIAQNFICKALSMNLIGATVSPDACRRKCIFIFKLYLNIIILLYSIIIIPLYTEEKPEESHIKKYRKWGYVLSESLEKFDQKRIDKIFEEYDIVCIAGIKIGDRGQLRYVSEWLNRIDKYGLKSYKNKIYPMIILSDRKAGIAILGNKKYKEKSFQNIISFLKTNELIGVHLDYEDMPGEFSESYGNYLKDLKKEFAGTFKLSMALYPPLEFKTGEDEFHNLKYISKESIDELVLMTYDYFNQKTEPGCVTNLDWAKRNLDEVLKTFDRNQIWLGIPAYGYEWSLKGKPVYAISDIEATKLTEKYQSSRQESGCIKIEKKDKLRPGLIFYSDRETRALMEKIAKSVGVNGTALWRLGLERE